MANGRRVGRAWAMAMAAVASAGAVMAVMACGEAGSGTSTFGGGGDGRLDATLPQDDGGLINGEGGQTGREDGGLNADSACAAAQAVPKKAGVDVVFVIDNSHSMADEIERVQANLGRFANILDTSGLDYQVIMLSARGNVRDDDREDVDDVKGCLGVTADYPREVCVPPPLGLGPDGGCGDNPPRFHHLDHFPFGVASTNGMGLFTGMYSSDYSWEWCQPGSSAPWPGPDGGGWKKWARFDATKFFIVVTDDDALVPSPVRDDAGVVTEETYQVFDRRILSDPDFGPAGMFGTATNRKYVYNAIVGWVFPGGDQLGDGGCQSAPDAGIYNYAINQGDQHRKLAQLTGGVVDSICKDDWSPILSNLATTIVNRLGCQYLLSTPQTGGNQELDPEKVIVRYTPDNGQPQELGRVLGASGCVGNPNDWYYDNNVSPSRVMLCPGACSTIGAASTGRVDVLVGCRGTPPK